MRITIIGAGFSGTALATQLAQRLPGPHEVCLVGHDATFGRGSAFGAAHPEHLLDQRAGELGADPARPRDFADWLELSASHADRFLPRALYGDYLQRRLARAAAGGPLRLVRDKATALQRLASGYRVHLADGSDFASDVVVLAIGALPPRALPDVEPALATDRRYVGRPSAPSALARIADDARVLIVGTGVAMADAVASLRRQGHVGPITAISPHGLAPQAHARAPQRPVLPPALHGAVRRADVRMLLRTLRAMAAVGGDWRPLLDGLRPHVQTLWERMDAVQRGRFLRHLRPWWDAYRHRVAPDLGDLLARERDGGGLAIAAAHLLHAHLDRGVVRAMLRVRGDERTRTEAFDVLIRATGLDTDVAGTRHGLVVHLREADLLTADAHGLGAATGDDGEALDRRGDAVPGLYVLGPLQRAKLWEITAIPELRAEADRLARHLCAVACRPARVRVPQAITSPRRLRAYG